MNTLRFKMTEHAKTQDFHETAFSLQTATEKQEFFPIILLPEFLEVRLGGHSIQSVIVMRSY